MVERRLHVLIAWREPRAASAFFSTYPSTNGPFHTERVISRYPYCVFLRSWRDRTMNLVVRLLVRVFLPLVGLPQGVAQCLPPLVRPPFGWSTGLRAIPRDTGRKPFQRLRPALPTISFRWSGFDTAPTEARHAAGTMRVSPDFMRMITEAPSRPATMA